MKNSTLGKIKPFTIGNKIIFSIDERWINYFESEPIFQVVLNKNQIMLIGPKIVQDPTTNHNQSTMREID